MEYLKKYKLNPISGKLELVKFLAPESIGIIDVTYSDLVTKIAQSELIAGRKYRITDFATVHYMFDGDAVYNMMAPTINTGATEVLIVKAISNNKLDIRAYSVDYPQDIIHYDWNPDNWLNDIGFSVWGTDIITGFKGVIYFRHDTKNDNSMGYDFRNVKFRRWNNGFTDTSSWVNSYQGLEKTSVGVTDSNDFIDVLTFNCPEGESQYNAEVFNNHFKPIRDDVDKYYWLPSILQNNVFHLIFGFGWFQVFGNSFGEFCYMNTFNGYAESNKILNHFTFNIIGDSFWYNVIGNVFEGNLIKYDFSENVIGVYFNKNTIGNSFSLNTIGADFGYNLIGNIFIKNTVGIDCKYIQTEDKTTNSTAFRNNTVKNRVQGTDSSNLLLLDRDEYYEDHNTETYRRPDGGTRLMYYNDSDDRITKSPTL